MPVKRLPCAVLGSAQRQLALPALLLECLEARSGLPASLPVQETRTLRPLPVLAFFTVNETVNAFLETALPTLSLLAFSFGAVGGGGGAALTVIVVLVEALAPESSVTVSVAVSVPAAV